MTDDHKNVQNPFLEQLLKNKTSTTIFLINGVKLQGIITHYDSCAVMLYRDGHVQLVYKHAISTVMPNVPVNLEEGEMAVVE